MTWTGPDYKKAPKGKKTCAHDECKYKPFGGGYCRLHQYLRDPQEKGRADKLKSLENKPKKLGSIKPMSDKRSIIERQLKKNKSWIWEHRPHLCESCGCNASGTTLEISHIVSKARRSDLIAEIENMTIACRSCHLKIEARRFTGMLNEDYLKNYLEQNSHSEYWMMIEEIKKAG